MTRRGSDVTLAGIERAPVRREEGLIVVSDEATLIAEHIEENPQFPGAADAWLRESGIRPGALQRVHMLMGKAMRRAVGEERVRGNVVWSDPVRRIVAAVQADEEHRWEHCCVAAHDVRTARGTTHDACIAADGSTPRGRPASRS